MFDDGSKLDVEVSREPVTGLQMSEQLLRRWTSQRVALHLLAEELLLLQEFLRSPVVVNSTGPVVTHENVDGLLDLIIKKTTTTKSSFKIQGCNTVKLASHFPSHWESFDTDLLQFEDLNVSDVVNTSQCIGVVRREFMMPWKKHRF